MNILIIWAESINKNNGGSIHLSGWCKGFTSLGHNVKVVAPLYGRGKRSKIENVSYIRLPSRSLFSFAILQIGMLLLLPYLLLRYRPNVIFVRTCFMAFSMSVLSRLLRIPIIIEAGTVVEAEVNMRGESSITARMVRLLNKLNFRFASGIATVTSGARQEYIRQGANPEKVTVIHNGANVDLMKPMEKMQARQEFDLPLNGYVVGFSGSFAPWQGLDLLIRSAKLVVERISVPIYFILVGCGECYDELNKQVEVLGLGEHVLFRESVPFEWIATFNNACDVTVLPVYDQRRLRYGLDPLKFWDSVSCGVPVLVPRGSGLEEFLAHLRLPGVYEPGDESDLAEMIFEVINQSEYHQSRRDEVHKMVSERYSWESIVGELTDFAKRVKGSGQ